MTTLRTPRAPRLSALLLLLPSIASAQSAPADSVVYVLSPTSRFEVMTGKTGLFSFAAHVHLIRATQLSGRIVFYPDAPAQSRVEISVPAAGLEVLTPPDTAEIRKVTEAMRKDVLQVDRYDAIGFRSKTVTPIEGGFRIGGELTIVGQTRELKVDLTSTQGADTLRAQGAFSIKQTDFGIKPYKGGPGGVIKVADRLDFRVEAIGVRETGTGGP